MSNYKLTTAAVLFLAAVASPPAYAQTPVTTPSPVGVYDANGRLIGPLTQYGEALVSLESGRNFAVPVSTAGFGTKCGSNCVAFFHTNAHCNGRRYFIASTVPVPTVVYDGYVIFPGLPIAQQHLLSQEIFDSRQPYLSKPGICQQVDLTLYVGPAASRLLTSLGNFVPPFVAK